MRLTDFIDEWERDEESERRRLAEEKSYEILDIIDLEGRMESVRKGDSLFGSQSQSIFVGRGDYPRVTTGILSPLDSDANPRTYATDSQWYANNLDITNVLQYRTGLMNSTRSETVDVHDVWEGFVGTQREIAIADRPVGVEIGLNQKPSPAIGLDDITSPTGPSADAGAAKLTENPHIPRPVEKTLEDDDWNADGAMAYLYEKGFDVYQINQILSAGTLGLADNRRLVPTRWSITAVDDTIGKHLREGVRDNRPLAETRVFTNEYVGNKYWIVLAPGRWEFELVEMKAPGSVWNPNEQTVHLSSAYEGYSGRTGYVSETAGAYYAARLGVLEYLNDIGRQAKCLVLREVTDEYWAPVGVWQVRESVRGAFGGECGVAETLHGAVNELLGVLPVSRQRLRRKSELVSGVQTSLDRYR